MESKCPMFSTFILKTQCSAAEAGTWEPGTRGQELWVCGVMFSHLGVQSTESKRPVLKPQLVPNGCSDIYILNFISKISDERT